MTKGGPEIFWGLTGVSKNFRFFLSLLLFIFNLIFIYSFVYLFIFLHQASLQEFVNGSSILMENAATREHRMKNPDFPGSWVCHLKIKCSPLKLTKCKKKSYKIVQIRQAHKNSYKFWFFMTSAILTDTTLDFKNKILTSWLPKFCGKHNCLNFILCYQLNEFRNT